MPAQPQDDLLLSLQSSLRNAEWTFGASSPQYANIKAMVESHVAKTAEKKEQGLGSGRVMNLAFRPKGKS